MGKFLRNSFFKGLGLKFFATSAVLLIVLNHSRGQVSLTNASPSAAIDFSNTMQTGVGTNTGTAYTAAGFSPNPTNANAGRLNSNAWAVTGWSDGNLAFGGTATSVDYTRGSTGVAVTSGGFYAYTGAPHSVANPCFMIQPGGGDFTPGTITLRIINNGTTNITQFDISYNLFVRNDQGRANSFNFSYSADDITYTAVAALDYTSTAAADGLGWVQVGSSPSRSTSVTGLNILPGASFFIRWSSADVSGTGSRDEFGLDDIAITATYNSCIASTTVSSFTPTSGPAGTQVTIIGTGLHTATGVKFGGISGTILSQTATILVAEVPAGAVTGNITVIDASCTSQSAAGFTVLSQNANCGTGATGTDLIISEVFDSKAGTLSYVEIFNPTASAIALTNYNIRIVTDGSTINDLPALTGSLASGAVGIIRIGDPTTSGSTVCTVTTIQTNDAASGFNGNDRVILRKSGVDLDVADNPNYGGTNPPSGDDRRGFSQLRNAGNITPRTTYVASEWTNADPETCSHLGIAPSAVSSSNVTITTQPSDVNCSAVTFSVVASAVPGTISYVWRYHAPGDAGWSLVSSLNGTNGLTVAGSGTSSITISGNTSVLKDYQFYCEIGSGGSPECVKYSNAAQYTYDSRTYYRSRASGQWTNPLTWEMSDTETGTYVAACQYPVAVNCNKVNIVNTHTVTLDADITIDWVNINTGASLIINSSSLLSFNNGNTAGADLEVNGTLTDGGTTANGTDFATGATWLLSANGTMIKTSNSSAAGYRDNYEGGMSTIPATANWYIRYNGSSDPSFTTVGGTFYPNLTLESNSGAWNPLIATSRFSGNSGFATIKGNLNIGGSGTGSVIVYNENTNASPLQILGNLVVQNGSTLTNNGSSSGTGFEVIGNVTVNGTFTSTGAGAAGTLILSGTAAQSVNGTGTINLFNLTINNSSTGAGNGVTLNRAVSMNGSLSLTNGLVNTTSTNLLSLSSSASSSAGSTSSFINGPLRKTGNTAFTFPVGKFVSGTGQYRTISIANLSGTETFTAEFMRANARNLGPVTAVGLQRVSQCEYWVLDRLGSSVTADVTLTWTSQSPCTVSYVTEPATTVVAHFNGTNWDSYGGSGTGSPSPGSGSATWSNVAVFSPFALGSTSVAENPLPFNLLAFDVVKAADGVSLNWEVLNNYELEEYILEWGVNGIDFQQIKKVLPAVNLQRDVYRYVHHQPGSGWNYYRLKARDVKGNLHTSGYVKIWWGKGRVLTVGPNPAKEKIVIYLSDPSSILQIDIVNSTGQRIMTTKTITFNTVFNTSQLQAGMYFIRILEKNGLSIRPFVKE
jgi:hypothetical protein